MARGLIDRGEVRGLRARKITDVTAQHFGYSIGKLGKKTVQIAPYYDADGNLVAQKVRFADKDFRFLGDAKAALPFGANAFPKTGRKLVVTEGEIDAMSFSQVQNNKYPVVSIGCGAGRQIGKYFSKRLDYFNGFDEVILMFDNDEPGREAAKSAAAVLKNAKIATLPLKDANDMLVAGRTEELINAFWKAEEYRPEGIVSMSSLLDKALTPPEMGIPWPFESLTELTFGMRLGELYAIGAGTGIGKTDFFTETVANMVRQGHKVGYFALEQMPAETATRIAGKLLGKPLHIPDVERTEAEVRAAFELAEDKVFLYDSFGANEWEVVKEKIEYLHHDQDVNWFFLDHLTALAASEVDERKGLDSIMADMGALVKRLNITITFISHLATPEGKPHEEGGRVTIRHFRGSRAIGFWAHYMFGLERDQQAEHEGDRAVTVFRVLKDRYTGRATGSKFHFTYNHETGLLSECAGPDEAADFGFAGEETEF